MKIYPRIEVHFNFPDNLNCNTHTQSINNWPDVKRLHFHYLQRFSSTILPGHSTKSTLEARKLENQSTGCNCSCCCRCCFGQRLMEESTQNVLSLIRHMCRRGTEIGRVSERDKCVPSANKTTTLITLASKSGGINEL